MAIVEFLNAHNKWQKISVSELTFFHPHKVRQSRNDPKTGFFLALQVHQEAFILSGRAQIKWFINRWALTSFHDPRVVNFRFQHCRVIPSAVEGSSDFLRLLIRKTFSFQLLRSWEFLAVERISSNFFYPSDVVVVVILP